MAKSDLASQLKALETFIRDRRLDTERIPKTGPRRRSINVIDLLQKPDVEVQVKLAAALWTSVHTSRTVSRKYVSEAVQHAVRTSLQGGDDTKFEVRLADAIRELRSKLTKSAAPWRVFVPILGADSLSMPATVGRVRFNTVQGQFLKTLQRRVRAIIDSTANTASQKRSHKRTLTNDIKIDFEGKQLASVSIRAVDRDAAVDVARDEIRATLDTINFFADLALSPGLRSAVFLTGERANGVERSLVFQERESFVYPHHVVGPMALLQLSEVFSGRTGRHDAQRVSRWLKLKDPNTFQLRVLSAIKWAGRATTEHRADEALLFYVVALETLMLDPKQTADIGYRLRIRCAHLLARNVADRAEIFDQVGKLYSKRSKLVHRGTSAVTPDDVATARALAKESILSILSGRVRPMPPTAEQFDKWLDRRVLQ
jgi:hypothetical protein